jgi:drug/metabolite transporter (DMT)-like permease
VILGVIGSALQIVMTTAYRYSGCGCGGVDALCARCQFRGLLVILFFAEIMSASEIIGALVIIASCLVIAWRELVRTREVNQPGI